MNRHDTGTYRAHYCINNPKRTTSGRLDHERSILRDSKSVWTDQVDVINYSNEWTDELPFPNDFLVI
jgi:hypothetical protein